MRTTMMPPRERADTPDVLDVAALAHVIDHTTDPDLFAPALPGETTEELAARRAAAADILDDLLTEAADEFTVTGWFV
ncbi:hypothetical protein [Nocardiopsis dassonvillei]|uniref:hypothetical protein n=1 Tax=Nocardiopsis dassonvillei TaxID=2014 RepID=UPI003F55408E